MWWYWRQRIIAGLLLATASYLAADLVNVVMGASLEASVPVVDRMVEPKTAPPLPPVNVDAILQGNLFQPSQRGGVASFPAASEPPVAVESTHRLVGTVTGSDGFGFAVMEEKSSKAQSLYRTNDVLPGGAQLVSIERYAIVIQAGSVTHRLAVTEDLPSAETGSPAAAAAGIREMSANHWLIERRKVDDVLANLPQLLTQARLIPNFSGGKADGFRLSSINPNSFFAAIGLQEGDVLQRVNGVEVKDPQSMLTAFQQLKSEANINLDVQRRSQPATLAYEIR